LNVGPIFRTLWRVKRFLLSFGWLLAVCLLAGCDKPLPASPSGLVAPSVPSRAQPRLQTLKLWLGASEITAELALTGDQIQTGMMFRTNVAEAEGMLFVFNTPHRASFWMKNVPIPLTCAYIDPDGRILEIRDMVPHEEAPIAAATDRVQYVLEMRQGWFGRNHVTTGALVRTERGSLQETFFKRSR